MTAARDTNEITDPHGLLQSGEELATIGEIAPRLGCSKTALASLLHGPLHELVRRVCYNPGTRYCVADVVKHYEPHRAEVEARRARGEALENGQRAASAKAKADRQAAHAALMAKKKAREAKKAKVAPAAPAPVAKVPTKPVQVTSRAGGPEVYLRRARG
jgi:hypothetical protein